MPGTATYVYCIVHATRAPRTVRVPAGLPGATRPAAIAAARSLWLIGADVPLDIYGPGALEPRLRDVDWIADVAVAHEAAIEYFARQPASIVVPMKLFTMFSSPERAVDDVRARRRAIQAILKRIAGCEEWGVRMMPRAVPVRGGVHPAPTTGAAFLASKKDARDRERKATLTRSAAADRTFSALAAIARDARRRDDAPGGAAPPLLDAAFLVPAGHRARFKAAVKRLAAEAEKAGATTTLTGPWPAYNFVQTDTAA